MRPDIPILVVITGAMGSGKSKIREKLNIPDGDCEIIDLDRVAREMVQAEERKKPSTARKEKNNRLRIPVISSIRNR